MINSYQLNEINIRYTKINDLFHINYHLKIKFIDIINIEMRNVFININNSYFNQLTIISN